VRFSRASRNKWGQVPGGGAGASRRHPEALDKYGRALNCARSGNDRTRECRFLFGLSLAQFNAHQIEAMLDTSERSGALAKELGEVAIQASSMIAGALGKGVCEGRNTSDNRAGGRSRAFSPDSH
jgi:hypothetical protein